MLSRSATREATRMYHVLSNNHDSFHLWWKENLVKQQKISKYNGQNRSFLLIGWKGNLLNHQKVSKYYEHGCRYQISTQTDNVDFLNYIPQKKVFPVENRKSEHHHGILHIRISLSTKFQLKLKISSFSTKFTEKGYFKSKT